jgi:hypothetical protein
MNVHVEYIQINEKSLGNYIFIYLFCTLRARSLYLNCPVKVCFYLTFFFVQKSMLHAFATPRDDWIVN